MPRLSARLQLVGVLIAVAQGLATVPGRAQETLSRVPVIPGLVLLSTLEFPDGDRENLVELTAADSSGVRYAWHLLETRADGDTIMATFFRHVRATDLRGAPRLDPVFLPSDREERPGFTAFTISSAAYTELRDRGTVAYSVTSLASAGGVLGSVTRALGAGVVQRRARYKGVLTRVTAKPVAFPLLVNGRRAIVPAFQVRGEFTDGVQQQDYEFWVLADSAHPLLLKSAVEGQVLQVVRVNHPIDWPDIVDEIAATGGLPPLGTGAGTGSAASGLGGESGPTGHGTGRGAGPDAGGIAALERELGTACRIEVPGVYFAFNSARIAPASDVTLAALARLLARHPEWAITVEGHTDSIGTAVANQKLSERRAEAVRARLAERHGLDTRAWKAAGYGATRPLEPNATIEGRARNRRVELVRDC